MRFLYTKNTTTYDTLRAAIKEAEIEWLESKNQIKDEISNRGQP